MRGLLLLLALSTQPRDPRQCGTPPRDTSGTIVRSRAVVAQFRRLYPCPSTRATVGACVGWQVDHVIPLVCGGCDAVQNLQWLPTALKTAPGPLPKDRWERRVYCGGPR
ncbi:MAG: HNH endonuclease signature motif containing protein [Caldilineaceae bacterium]